MELFPVLRLRDRQMLRLTRLLLADTETIASFSPAPMEIRYGYD